MRPEAESTTEWGRKADPTILNEDLKLVRKRPLKLQSTT